MGSPAVRPAVQPGRPRPFTRRSSQGQRSEQKEKSINCSLCSSGFPMHMLTQRIIKMGGGEPVSATTGVRQVQGLSHARAYTGSDLHPLPHAWDPQPPTSLVDLGWLLCLECRRRSPCSMASVPSSGCVCANH
uniref:Uncharacterized protein n=1 Tax=Triticum urartu TaxID=4572 RepID=A0A8R7RD62_TRIUA